MVSARDDAIKAAMKWLWNDPHLQSDAIEAGAGSIEAMREVATLVVDAVEPIIRADEREQMTECGICYALCRSDSFSEHVEWHSGRGDYS